MRRAMLPAPPPLLPCLPSPLRAGIPRGLRRRQARRQPSRRPGRWTRGCVEAPPEWTARRRSHAAIQTALPSPATIMSCGSLRRRLRLPARRPSTCCPVSTAKRQRLPTPVHPAQGCSRHHPPRALPPSLVRSTLASDRACSARTRRNLEATRITCAGVARTQRLLVSHRLSSSVPAVYVGKRTRGNRNRAARNTTVRHRHRRITAKIK